MIMRYRTFLVMLGTGAAAATFTACAGSSTSPGSSSADAIQAAEDVSDQTAGDAGGIVSDFGVAETQAGASGDAVVGLPGGTGLRGNIAGLISKDRSSCTTGNITLSFTFPASDNRDTVYYNRTWEYFSALGCENAFVADSTDSVYYTVAFADSLNGKAEHWHSHLGGNRYHWLTGDSTQAGTLISATGIHVWNGNAVLYDTASFMNGSGTVQRTHDWQAADTLHNVTFPHPRSGDLYPVSGEFIRWVADSVTFSGAKSGHAVYAWHIVVSFGNTGGVGNEDAELQVYNADTGALVKTCTVDLLFDEIVPGSCH
jgi:hypothetical protein